MMTCILALLFAIGLISSVHSASFTCETDSSCVKGDEWLACDGDCTCGDTLVDSCPIANPTMMLYVGTINDCMAVCKGFALEDRCKFIIFHYDDGPMNNNCFIMNDHFESYIGECNIRGQALWGPTPNEGLARWTKCVDGNTCPNDEIQNNCNSCTDCTQDPCRGFILSSCTIYSIPLETSESASWDQCEQWARIRPHGTLALFTRDDQHCELFGGVYDWENLVENGFYRKCSVAMVELDTNPNTCGGAHRVLFHDS